MLPSGLKSLVVRVLCKAANLGFAVKTALSIGGIIVSDGVWYIGAGWCFSALPDRCGAVYVGSRA